MLGPDVQEHILGVVVIRWCRRSRLGSPALATPGYLWSSGQARYLRPDSPESLQNAIMRKQDKKLPRKITPKARGQPHTVRIRRSSIHWLGCRGHRLMLTCQGCSRVLGDPDPDRPASAPNESYLVAHYSRYYSKSAKVATSVVRHATN